jgi:hypothetical protein
MLKKGFTSLNYKSKYFKLNLLVSTSSWLLQATATAATESLKYLYFGKHYLNCLMLAEDPPAFEVF